MVILDATALLLLLNEKTAPPKHPETDEPIEDAHDRIAEVVKGIRERGDKILIAAPVLAEILVRAKDSAAEYVQTFNESAHFKPVPFDQLAAITHADITRAAIDAGDKKGGADDPLAKVKFDRQIVAIAKAENAHTIYTDDNNLAKHAEKQGITVIRTHEIVLNKQQSLFDLIDGESEKESEEILKGEAVIETAPPPLMPDSPA